MKKSNLLLSSLILLSFLLSGCFAQKDIDPFVLKAKLNGRLVEFNNSPDYYGNTKFVTIKGYNSSTDNYRQATYFSFTLNDSLGLSNRIYFPSHRGYTTVNYYTFSKDYGHYLSYIPISVNEFKVTIIFKTTTSLKGVFEGKVYRQGYPNEVIEITEGEFSIPRYEYN